MKFRSGDSVRQVDSGPLLVVDAFCGLKKVCYCQYMEGDKFKGGYFPEGDLKHADDREED